MDPLLTIDDELLTGIIVDRSNRSVVCVRFEDAPERAFLGDPDAFGGTVEPGNEIFCSPVDDPGRMTDHDATTVRVDGAYVSAHPALANDLFECVLARDTIPAFVGCSCLKREPVLPEHGWTGLLVETPADRTAFVETKSCTHVENGVTMFPDRQIEHNRCHLRSLEAFSEDGHETYVAFVVQWPGVERFHPY